MALTQSEVLASLERVASPDGLALPKTGALSDIVVSDGKVFFSITVDAAVVNAWEPVRRRALVLSFVATLAKVHAVDWRGRGLSFLLDRAEAARPRVPPSAPP